MELEEEKSYCIMGRNTAQAYLEDSEALFENFKSMKRPPSHISSKDFEKQLHKFMKTEQPISYHVSKFDYFDNHDYDDTADANHITHEIDYYGGCRS